MKFKQVAVLLWHWSWLIVLGTAVAGVTAYVASQNTAPLYRATSQLIVDQRTAESDSAAAPNLAPTYAAMIQTRPVLEAAIVHLNLAMTTDQLAEMLTVSVPENTQLVTISVADTNSERAALIANTVSQAFISQNRARNEQRYADPIANWQQELEATNAEITALKEQVAANPSSQTNAQLEGAQERYTDALSSLTELQMIQANESDHIVQVESAQSSPTPILPRTTANVVWAAVIGAVVTTAIALRARRGTEASAQTLRPARFSETSQV